MVVPKPTCCREQKNLIFFQGDEGGDGENKILSKCIGSEMPLRIQGWSIQQWKLEMWIWGDMCIDISNPDYDYLLGVQRDGEAGRGWSSSGLVDPGPCQQEL